MSVDRTMRLSSYMDAFFRLATTEPIASSTLLAIAATDLRIAGRVHEPVCGRCHEPQVACGEIFSKRSMMSGGACTKALSPLWQP